MEMCYRGVKYTHNPVVLNLSELKDAAYPIVRIQTIQTKFRGRVCYKETVAVTIAEKQTRFLGRVHSPIAS